jgi:arylsulfatase A-like enzyme
MFSSNWQYSTIVVVVALSVILAGCGDSPEGGGENNLRRPNVILIMSDDQGWGDVSYNGNKILKTPQLDQMAADGVRLDRFYAAAPVCSPTRGSVLTGRHPYRLGIPWAGDGHISASEWTLAEVLRDHGYRTGHFGKWHVGELSKTINQSYFAGDLADPESYSPPWENGYDESFVTESMVPLYNPYYHVGGEFGTNAYRHLQTEPVARGQRTKGFRWRDSYWTGPGQIVDDWLEGDDSEIVTDRAVDFIRRSVDESLPFLAVVWFHTPHTPIVAGDDDRAPYADQPMEAQHWFGALSAMDRQVGRVRELLRELEINENTIVWFNSDNGPSYIHDYNSSGGLRGKKAELWEGGIRVPAIVEWPAGLEGARAIAAPMSTSDIYPTILSMAGVPLPDSQPKLDGIDVTSLLVGAQVERGSSIGFQSPIRGTNPEDVLDGVQSLALIGDRYKLISFDSGESWSLFDLLDDPAEQQDIAEQRTQIAAEMRAELLNWVVDTQETLPEHASE